MKRSLVLLLVAVVAGISLWPFAFTVVPIDDAGSKPEVFDPVVYVDGIWDDVLTTIRNDSVDLAEILTAMAPNADGLVQKEALTVVTERFGLITPGEAHVYKLRLRGTVTTVDTDTSLGIITVAIEGYDGPVSVQVYVGPRIRSDESSVRDAVGFIQFGDFRDQTEYGKVASEINSRVSAGLATIDTATLKGATVTVLGAMTIRTFNLVEIDVRKVDIVPVAIERS